MVSVVHIYLCASRNTWIRDPSDSIIFVFHNLSRCNAVITMALRLLLEGTREFMAREVKG